MAERPMHLQTGFYLNVPANREPAGSGDGEETRRVEATVVALIPEYHQVKVRDGEGHIYALTRKTAGVQLSELHEGQRVLCTITRRLPRVLSAAAVA